MRQGIGFAGLAGTACVGHFSCAQTGGGHIIGAGMTVDEFGTDGHSICTGTGNGDNGKSGCYMGGRAPGSDNEVVDSKSAFAPHGGELDSAWVTDDAIVATH